MSIICVQGHTNPDGSLFCAKCGEMLSEDSAVQLIARICTHCGTPNTLDVDTCLHCNASLDTGEDVLPPALPGQPRLVIVPTNIIIDLSGREETIIGRTDASVDLYPDVDLTPYGADDSGVSRRHMQILFKDGHYFVEDLNSVNFTYVNRQLLKANQPHSLKSGDEIRIGRMRLIFEIGQDKAE